MHETSLVSAIGFVLLLIMTGIALVMMWIAGRGRY